MKKILALSLVALFSFSALAQVQQATSVEKVHVNKMMSKQTIQEKQIVNSSELTLNPRKVTTATDNLFYLRPEGTFFTGFASGFAAYNPIIVTDTTGYTFPNVSEMNTNDTLLWAIAGSDRYYFFYAWDYDNNVPIDYISDGIPAGYYVSTPLLTTFDKDDELVSMFQWGGEEAIMLSKPNEFLGALPFTTSPMYDADGKYNYGIYSYDENSWIFGKNSSFEYSDTKEKFVVDTIIVVYDNLSTMWMDSLILPVYTEASSISNMFAADAELSFDILPVTIEEGKYLINPNPVVTLKATQSDVKNFEPAEGGYLGMATIDVPFGAKNALGGFTPQPLTITGAFAVQFSGFNKGCDFGVPSDKIGSYPSVNTFFRVDNRYTAGFGLNMALSLNAMFVTPGQETGVENVSVNNDNVEKVVVDGQVLIRKGDKTYNVLGAEVK